MSATCRGERILGLSKLARIVGHFAARPQTQERMTRQIADFLEDELCPAGAGVVLEAEHTCMTLRGVRSHGASTVTSALTGVLRADATARAEFLALAGVSRQPGLSAGSASPACRRRRTRWRTTPSYVIVGASLAGAKAAETLRAESFGGPVVLIGTEDELPYERPPLSKDYLLGKAERDMIYVHPRQWYADNDVDLRLGVTVTGIDRAARDGDARRRQPGRLRQAAAHYRIRAAAAASARRRP